MPNRTRNDQASLELHQPTWLLLADGGKARLVRAGIAPLNRTHVDEVETYENDNLEHERSRPSPRAGRAGSTADNHEPDEQLLRFARKVNQWVHQRMKKLEIDQLDVIAPPRMLGALRKVRANGMRQQLQDHEADLTSFSTAQLADHPAIRKCIGLNSARQQRRRDA